MNTITQTTVVILAFAAFAFAEFTVYRTSIDGGGALLLTGDGFSVNGTIGQPDAGALSGDGFVISGGFWLAEPPGDCNATGNVELFDYAEFTDCFTGPVPPPGGVECPCFDLDADEDVDLVDFGLLQTRF